MTGVMEYPEGDVTTFIRTTFINNYFRYSSHISFFFVVRFLVT